MGHVRRSGRQHDQEPSTRTLPAFDWEEIVLLKFPTEVVVRVFARECVCDLVQIKEMVVAAKEMSGGLPTSVKIRVEDDLRKTVDLIRTVEQAGVAWITVHGRTARQFTRVPVNLDAIKLVFDFFFFFVESTHMVVVVTSWVFSALI